MKKRAGIADVWIDVLDLITVHSTKIADAIRMVSSIGEKSYSKRICRIYMDGPVM